MLKQTLLSLFICNALLSCTLATSSECPDTNLNGEGYELCGVAEGNFVYLGSFCFPAGSDDTLSISFYIEGTVSSSLKALFYTDKEKSFPSVCLESDAGQALSCHERTQLSSNICFTGDSCTYGMIIKNFTANDQSTAPVGTVKYTTTIRISEKVDRQWYFVLSDCNTNFVEVQEYSIHSSSAESCENVFILNYNHGGYIAAMIILIILCVGTYLTAKKYYVRTKLDVAMLEDDGYSAI